MLISPLPVKGWNFRPIPGANSLGIGRDLVSATPTVTEYMDW